MGMKVSWMVPDKRELKTRIEKDIKSRDDTKIMRQKFRETLEKLNVKISGRELLVSNNSGGFFTSKYKHTIERLKDSNTYLYLGYFEKDEKGNLNLKYYCKKNIGELTFTRSQQDSDRFYLEIKKENIISKNGWIEVK